MTKTKSFKETLPPKYKCTKCAFYKLIRENDSEIQEEHIETINHQNNNRIGKNQQLILDTAVSEHHLVTYTYQLINLYFTHNLENYGKDGFMNGLANGKYQKKEITDVFVLTAMKVIMDEQQQLNGNDHKPKGCSINITLYNDIKLIYDKYMKDIVKFKINRTQIDQIMKNDADQIVTAYRNIPLAIYKKLLYL